MSTGTSKVDKLLKMPSDSISEGVIFQHFLGDAPRPPSAGMLCMPVCLAHYECKHNRIIVYATVKTLYLVLPPAIIRPLSVQLCN